jgi:hypothetical protein
VFVVIAVVVLPLVVAFGSLCLSKKGLQCPALHSRLCSTRLSVHALEESLAYLIATLPDLHGDGRHD